MILILSVAAFGYSQYSAITSISSTMINSQDMGAVPLGHMYKIQIDFENPSLLMLAIGESEFTITASNPVFVKKLAEMLAYVAAPPISHFSTFVGVLIVSKATEPNTTNMQNLLFIA